MDGVDDSVDDGVSDGVRDNVSVGVSVPVSDGGTLDDALEEVVNALGEEGPILAAGVALMVRVLPTECCDCE